MATIPVSVEEKLGAGGEGGNGQFVRVILADTQAIFRAGLRKVFALEDDILAARHALLIRSSLRRCDAICCVNCFSLSFFGPGRCNIPPTSLRLAMG